MRYFYATIDEDNICVGTSSLSGEATNENMILIAVSESTPEGFYDLMGKQYNPETGEWADPVYYYYVKIDADGIVVDAIRSLTEGTPEGYMQVDSLDDINTGYVYYNNAFMAMDKANYLMLKALIAQ